MKVPKDLLYGKDHEWIRVEGDEAVVGITDHAQEQLGEVVFADLPGKGESFAKEDPIASLESVKAVSEVYSPVSGQVLAVNDKLADSPETINESPYEEGWIVRLRLADKSDLDGLMSAADYEKYLEEEGED